jgi:hypothetical protein
MRTNTQVAYWGAVALLILVTALYTRAAISGDWFRSGNDMQFILEDLRARPISDYWSGPWAGQKMFRYYRPVTSTVFAWELAAFGTDARKWQTLGWLLHLASIPLLAFVLLRLVGSRIGALVGTTLWALRDRIVLTIEWVPAQTDLLAGFFALLCLASFLHYQARGSRSALALTIATGLLSALSKEIGFILVGLLPLTVLFSTQSYRSALRVFSVTLSVGLALLAVRWFALSGAGFLPGQPVGTGVAALPAVGSFLRHWLRFLLPGPIGPGAVPSVAAVWVFSLSLVAAFLVRRRPLLSVATALGGLVAVALLLGDAAWLLLGSTWAGLLSGAWCFLALVFALLADRPRGWFVLLYGFAAALPLYHVVYNPAGNVTYLPGTYHALLWGWIVATAVSALSGTLRLSFPGTDAKS